ncbi:YihY/virulence factor BrkB family protein [Muribaculaceae bacterium Isolate-083 (Janvier)]|uniref:YihY/virulence factor BrkB family protein n=3 Tax=Duncaniella muris TaxID=2094150 RepID=UPI000F499601|nr:YihY/virulence factor BrkB family protein [Duncaniella muris]ROS96097.1 YihY/virulence factor BrkB family protein [Muribaculaceae bacterium Isolate-083 (Janvier)]ROS98199.1 YihY/virulence factor BrkB family protein [Muribaculaceae bacterium Isolate-077 (Janvier)]ROT01377.1 YihY/virulence factor BrkB family protein [Muribaculaceae bacterium Isolate-084 (Janvier)]
MIFTKEKKDISAGSNKPQSLFERLKNKALDIWEYCSKGVWEDKRDTLKIRIVKTLNLTIRTFMSADLQSKACAMTYRTLLAIVPALALLFAIGRGFGFQNLLQNQVYQYLPSQRKALEMAFSFVDSCLAQASEGIFVGVGIIFLLWTLISLLDSVEESFNNIWGITADRPLARKVTDYLAIFIILPVLMICSSGLQIFMSTTIQKLLPFADITPFLGDLLDLASVALSWLFFAGAYMLIPNTKVRFQNALIAGVLAGTAFQILQWLFVTGQVYVAKYNAIYGSFSFLPLMLIWMQLSWLITLAGALVCCSSQNINMFSFEKQTDSISSGYRRKVSIAMLTVILKRFCKQEKPYNISELSAQFLIPPKLTGLVVNKLIECNLIVRLAVADGSPDETDPPLIPATSPEHYTLGHVLEVLDNHGESDFIPEFDQNFRLLTGILDKLSAQIENEAGDIRLADIQVNNIK